MSCFLIARKKEKIKAVRTRWGGGGGGGGEIRGWEGGWVGGTYLEETEDWSIFGEEEMVASPALEKGKGVVAWRGGWVGG